ncbi:MAG: alpha/beta hydrolase [Candidatus Hydrogenedentes bacterium]|nr:alpha/beta hydrolase [Candidatus Hydrogenedentota bacterium]
MFWSVFLIFVSVFIGLAVILTVFQSRFIYFPERGIIMTPREIGLSYEAVNFEASDGVKLSGWFVPAEDPRGVVLFCHGNAGNISHRLESIQVFHRLGLSTFIFDYRGYGQSEGRITEQGTYLDAEAAWRYLVEKQHTDPTEIVIFGRSLGGAIGAWLAQDHTPSALIIESTFASIPDIAADLYPYLPVRHLARFHYAAINYLRQVHCPVLIVHSRDDEMISFSHGRRLLESANEPKELLEIRGTHNEGFITSADRYESGLESFISKHVGK